MAFTGLVALAARLMEGLGILTMLLGTLLAGTAASMTWNNEGGAAAFKRLRQQLGREVPSLTGVTVLAMIVLIRTFLSFTLQVELEGKWPWQRERQEHPARRCEQ